MFKDRVRTEQVQNSVFFSAFKSSTSIVYDLLLKLSVKKEVKIQKGTKVKRIPSQVVKEHLLAACLLTRAQSLVRQNGSTNFTIRSTE
mmetsp:Transcript_56230/g.136290  ORF Transcript_56230/g.136290 Transcript_56230/m.136290 type:complete len:88 (+) Transcript_56230:4731-4994(+)